MSTDILDDLKSWLSQLVQDKTHRERTGEAPGVEINLVNWAIDEITPTARRVGEGQTLMTKPLVCAVALALQRATEPVLRCAVAIDSCTVRRARGVVYGWAA
jgi:hypothetical protein